jgi:PAS domain S-box-containing protein
MLRAFNRPFLRRWSARAQLAAVVESADDAIISKDLNGIITSWNSAAERMFGHTAAEAVGRPITIIIPPDRLHEEVEILSRLRRGEAIRHFETERVRKDGQRVPISLAISPMRDRNGRVIGASKIARDITERRRSEQALREAMQRLAGLYRLADEVGRAKEIGQVCEAAVESIVAGGADRASILLFDDEGVMRFRASRGLSAAYIRAVDGHSPWRRDTRDPQPIVVGDVSVDSTLETLRDVIVGEGIRALAFVPLVSHEQLLGKFMVYYDAPHVFSAEEMRLAHGIGQHVTFGLARVKAEAAIEELLGREMIARREAEGRGTVAEELARLARAMTETLDIGTVGQRVVSAAMNLFGARAAALRLTSADGSLVGVAFGGTMAAAFSAGHAIPQGPASLSGLAMIERRALWTDDSFSDARLQLAEEIRRGMAAAGDAALLAAPLRNGTDIFGALSVADRLGRRFTSADAETLQGLADQAALAIVNARLYGEARRRQREAEVVAEVTQRINASLDLDTTLDGLVRGARELCDADIAKIVVRDGASGRMVLRQQVGGDSKVPLERRVVEPGHGTGGIVLVTGTPFRTDDYAADPRITDHYMAVRDADGTVAQLVVPIPGDGGTAGLLYVDRRTRRPFTDADEAVLVRLADHAATAIQNSQLFAAEQAARAEADAANRGKDRFLAVLSHELRTPLNAILGWVRLLRAGQLDDAQQLRALGVIERNAQLQAQLVADLLDVSRITAGKMEIERGPVDLLLVVREALEAALRDAEAKGLALVTDLDEAAGEVFGDAGRLQQVVSNLVLNAIKFTPAGGRVEIGLRRHGANARLIVADTGEGIDPALLERIFDPFEQGDTSTTRAHQGLGLGLAIVKQLVELHGGTIRAQSQGKGLGATFTIDLPVLAVRLNAGMGGFAARETGAPSASLGGMRVLVVDDEADARELIAQALRTHGAVAYAAGAVSEALDVLRIERVDVLVSDISMPERDGFDLIREVRESENNNRLHAIAVTAYAGHEVRDRALAAGFDGCATKPLDPTDLVRMLRAVYRG